MASRYLTNEEAFALRPGTRLEMLTGKGWVLVEVVRVKRGAATPNGDLTLVSFRRIGATKDGRRFPVSYSAAGSLRLPADLDPAPANVYADWLDEHGEPAAAAKLRQAFPIG